MRECSANGTRSFTVYFPCCNLGMLRRYGAPRKCRAAGLQKMRSRYGQGRQVAAYRGASPPPRLQVRRLPRDRYRRAGIAGQSASSAVSVTRLAANAVVIGTDCRDLNFDLRRYYVRLAQKRFETAGIATMKRPKSAPIDLHDWDARAEQALAEARRLPSGPERGEALKKASALRIAADLKGVSFAKRGRPTKS